MPSGTFRMEQCLQTVTILNTIALKKKKKSLTKKSKGSHFCDFFLFFVFFKKCKLASGREWWCRKLPRSFSFKDKQPGTLGGVGLHPSLFDSAQQGLCDPRVLKQRDCLFGRWSSVTKPRHKLPINNATQRHTTSSGTFLGPSEDKWTCHHNEILGPFVPKKQQLLAQSNLEISLGVILSSHKSGPFTSVCLLVKPYDNNT